MSNIIDPLPPIDPSPLSSVWLLTWQEDDNHLVACRFFDVVVQGPTFKIALDRFYKAFTFEVLLRVREDGTIDPLPVPPPEVLQEWERKAGFQYVKR